MRPLNDHPYRSPSAPHTRQAVKKTKLFCKFFGHRHCFIITQKIFNKKYGADYGLFYQAAPLKNFLYDVEVKCSACKVILKDENEPWPKHFKISFFDKLKIRYHFSTFYTENELLELEKVGFIEL